MKLFWLLALINLLVGGMVGLERTVVPLLAKEAFGVEKGAALGGFILSFGLAKALFNLLAGALADRFGRKGVLVLGWAFGVPVPLLLIWAPSWGWVVAANVLLGVNQALAWSMTVNMMVDLVPPHRRGVAAGVNEFAGYLGVSLLAFLTGVVAEVQGLRPAPFYLGLGVALLAFALSLGVRETYRPLTPLRLRWVPGIGVASLLGLLTNLKDGLVWLALPLLLAYRGFGPAEIGLVAGLYPLVWAGGQLVFGPLSDRNGRAPLIVGGIALQGLGLLLLALPLGFGGVLLAAFLLGLGTSMAYPTLIAWVADRAPLEERATALGLYRFFRDGGYVLGALLAGVGLEGLSGVIGGVGIGMALLSVWATWSKALKAGVA
ncbi:MFS transporter [Thermus thermophilus]|uniref:MFS transporter n=1 Tax=Thermus thermophilus TaxID=274 RepID=A0AAD1NYX8_THETH|nr:MFS transporter [Thermus thermophilus]BBL82653.1 MFS transporter [Thermus thermophilus]BBL84952.1 MFS transporter [Thermus thermophilus]BCZ87307.1 MFS transporter [Thermus thermophilus]BCZ89676.1 MFS transporter [Thermus thermophilus]BCZ92329.1 MFS transporter [Thermus thermophilus]